MYPPGGSTRPHSAFTEGSRKEKSPPTALLLLQLCRRARVPWANQRAEPLDPNTLSPCNSRLRLAITGWKAWRELGEVTRGRRSPAAWSADGFSKGGTGGSQSTSRSSLYLQAQDRKQKVSWQQRTCERKSWCHQHQQHRHSFLISAWTGSITRSESTCSKKESNYCLSLNWR